MTPLSERPRSRRVALKAAGVYAVLGAVWILLSDAVVAALVTSPGLRVAVATVKGWAFMVVTAFVLYGVLKRYLGEIEIGEEALRGSERRLERILQTIPNAVLVFDREGTVTSANRAAERLLRTHREELVGRERDDATWTVETLEGAPADIADAPYTRVMATGESVSDVRLALRHRDGSRTIISANASPLNDERGEIIAVVVAFTDVTGQYAAERKLTAVNRLYSMLSQTNQAIMRARDEERLYAEACRITVEYGRFRMAWVGLADEEAGLVRPAAHAGEDLGYLENTRITLGDEDEARGPVGTAIRLGRTVVSNDIAHDPHMRPWAEQALRRGYRSLAAVPLLIDGRAFGALAIYAAESGFFDAEETGLLEALAEDIAFGVSHIRHEQERVRTEAALREALASLDAVIARSPLPIVALDEQMCVTMWNRAAESVFGWSAEEVMGRRSPAVPPELADEQRRLLERTRREGELEGHETQRVTKDGRRLDVAMFTASIQKSDDGPVQHVALFLDVTAQRRVEQLKSDFVSNVSHELRTPLTAIVGFSDLLRKGGRGVRECREMAERIHGKAVELDTLVEGLLEAASIQAGSIAVNVVPTPIDALLAEVAAEASVPDGFVLDVRAEEGLPLVSLDRQRIGRALRSLLDNAFKYSPEGGTVRLWAKREGERLRLGVSDEGVGIAAEDVGRIFERFTQVDMSSTRRFAGVGIGLYMARQVAEAHRGRIDVESVPAEGSTFVIDLPL